jgi:hypothetical protein
MGRCETSMHPVSMMARWSEAVLEAQVRCPVRPIQLQSPTPANREPFTMKMHTLATVAVLAALPGCGGQSAPPSYPTSAAPATVVIIDTDLANAHLSVQDGDQVIAMMNGQHYAKVPIRPGAHNFSAGAGRRSEGSGTIPVDAQPGQAIYLQVGGISSRPGGEPAVPGFATSTGRAEGAFGQGGIQLIPQSSAEYLMKQSAEQQPLPPS